LLLILITWLNASEGDTSPYWHKAYVGKIAKDGSFQCVVSELKKTGGELVIGFCFNNGLISGNGNKPGLNVSGIKKAYSYSDGSWSVSE
jgi:hypothetical protein